MLTAFRPAVMGGAYMRILYKMSFASGAIETATFVQALFLLIRQPPTLPYRLQYSTIGR